MKMSAMKSALCVALVLVALSVSGVKADEHEDYDFYQNVEYTGHDEVNVSSLTGVSHLLSNKASKHPRKVFFRENRSGLSY